MIKKSGRELSVSSEHELKLRVTQNAQAKLLASINGKEEHELVDVVRQLKAIFDMGDFEFYPRPIEIIKDKYYDTKSLDLFKTHSSLRLRRSNGAVEFTAKKLKGMEKGEFNREENTFHLESAVTEPSPEQFEEIIKSVYPDVIGQLVFPMFEILNERRNFNLQRRDETYRLSIDLFRIADVHTNRSSGIISEIEIEATNESATLRLGDIKRNLIEILRTFAYSEESKYERGVKYFALDRKRNFFSFQAPGISGDRFALLGILLTVVGIVITVLLYFLQN